jgi:hypothetical protein
VYINWKNKQGRYKAETFVDVVITVVCFFTIAVIVTITFPRTLIVWYNADFPRLKRFVLEKLRIGIDK